MISTSQVPSLTIGGRVFTDLTNLITLFAQPSGAGARTTFRRSGSQSGAGYQVTAGKTLKIFAVRVISLAAASGDFLLAQIDADTGLAGATAFTNPKYFGSESATATSAGSSPAGIGASAQYEGAPMGSVTTGKFLGVDGQGTASYIFAYGYEV